MIAVAIPGAQRAGSIYRASIRCRFSSEFHLPLIDALRMQDCVLWDSLRRAVKMAGFSGSGHSHMTTSAHWRMASGRLIDLLQVNFIQTNRVRGRSASQRLMIARYRHFFVLQGFHRGSETFSALMEEAGSSREGFDLERGGDGGRQPSRSSTPER